MISLKCTINDYDHVRVTQLSNRAIRRLSSDSISLRTPVLSFSRNYGDRQWPLQSEARIVVH